MATQELNVRDGALTIVGPYVMDFDGTETEKERKRLIREAHEVWCSELGICPDCGSDIDRGYCTGGCDEIGMLS